MQAVPAVTVSISSGNNFLIALSVLSSRCSEFLHAIQNNVLSNVFFLYSAQSNNPTVFGRYDVCQTLTVICLVDGSGGTNWYR